MAELIFRGGAANFTLTGGRSIKVPTDSGGFVYIYAVPGDGIVASSSDPNPTPEAPKPKAKKVKVEPAEDSAAIEGDDA